MTAQTPDTILLDGQEWLLLGTPLDPVLAAAGVTRRLVAPHTANARGYLATWRVDADGRLFLDAVSATVRGLGSGTQTIHGSAVLRGATLPMAADFVTGQLRLARGAQVRHVHSDFDSVWADEILLEVDAGRVRSRRALTPASAMGTAGPYQLHEPLLAGLSGGGFGQVIAATDLDGTPLVAKAPNPRGGGSRTEMWIDTPAGRRPEHKPAQVFRADPAGSRSVEIGPDQTAAVLRREAEILERDGGRLLPRSLGVWAHEPSGLPILVMERLVGEAPETPGDVDLLLQALADAVDRGTFAAHGDVKPEHVFIEDGAVRMCDPAPRFDDPLLRALTPAYNPRGLAGPAADVAACATILRYLPDAVDHGFAGWRWCAAVLDSPSPPPWVHSHRAALAELRRDLGHPRVPPPPGWAVPAFPTDSPAPAFAGAPGPGDPPAGGGAPPAAGARVPPPVLGTIPVPAGSGLPPSGAGSWAPPAPSPPPQPEPPQPGPPVDDPSFTTLALVLRASVIEPVDPDETRAGGVFIAPSDHAVAALDTILQVLASTIDGHTRRFGVRAPEPPGMTVMVRRATRGSVTGLLAQTLSLPPVAVTTAGPPHPGRFVDLAWNAAAGTDLAGSCAHLAEAVRHLLGRPDPRAALDVVDVAQRVGGILTVIRRHVVDALREPG